MRPFLASGVRPDASHRARYAGAALRSFITSEPPVIFEAKYVSAGWKGPIREAVGQLYEYRYFKVADPGSSLILLASKEVPAQWVAYLEKDRHIGVVWRSGRSFGMSKLAKKILGK